MNNEKLGLDFFNRPVLNVAPALLGQILVFGPHRGIITEVEAYRGEDDPASHAFRGITPRSSLMFGQAGISYVYLIYGMYNCLNIVVENIGNPAAILIRGVKLLTPPYIHLNGPGKICRTMSITRIHNGIDLTTNAEFYAAKGSVINNFTTTARIGIKVGTDKLWRFIC